MSVSSLFHQSEIGSSTLASVGRDASTCAVCCQVPSSAIRERFALRPHSDRELPSKARSSVTSLQQRLGEDRRPAGEARAALLAAAGREPSDPAAVRSDDTPDCRATGGDGIGGTDRQARPAEKEGGVEGVRGHRGNHATCGS